MELDKIQTADLGDNKFIKELTQQVDHFVYWDETAPAWRAFLKLKDRLKKEGDRLSAKQYDQYIYLMRRLKFIALPLLSDEDTIDLFEKDLVFVWQANSFTEEELYDFDQKLKYKLTSVLLWQRDEFKARLRKAMKNNQQKITSGGIEVEQGRKVAPTIANWLQDYTDKLGTGQIDNLKQTNYLVNSLNTKNLSDQERNILRQLIRLYEKLRISSTTPEGIEEDVMYVDKNGQMKILHKGRFINLEDLNKKN